MRPRAFALALVLALAALANVSARAATPLPVRIGDLTVRPGDVPRRLVGYGLVTGLGTPDNLIGPTKEVATGMTSSSRNDGDVSRSGNLSAMLTVRVTGFEPGGLARIEGSKTVTMDGRTQQMTLKGVVRAQDVLPGNKVPSSRVADAVITYKGKKIAPKTGLLGGILNLLWP